MKKLFNYFLQTVILALLFISCQQKPVDYLNESKEDIDERMEWWREARFGMFIHWGLYAIPAGDWKGETNHAEWIRTTAQIPLDVYDEFVDEFNPVKFNANDWVKMAKDAGMKYIVITSKHHDGFCLFDSDYTDFDIMSTPYERDILKELSDACHKEGIRICWYHSIMDWRHPDYIPRRGWEVDRSEGEADFNLYISYMKNQIEELVNNYGDIGVLWFDGEWEGTWSNEYGKDLYNYVRNLYPDIIINNRVDVGRSGMAGMTRVGEYAGDFGTPEQEIPSTGLAGVDWETCMTMNDHWGYNKHDTNWKSTEDLIRKLADIASKGGNFLLNVGPTADGLFPDESIERLKKIGNWMDVNSDAIYKTEASPFKILSWGRCTQTSIPLGTRLFLHVFDWPEDGLLKVPGIYNQPLNTFLLADVGRSRLKAERMEDALIIKLPITPLDEINTVVVLDVAGKPDINNPPVIEREHDLFIDLIMVNIYSDRDNIEIRYTVDGLIPDQNSQVVNGKIKINETTTIIARCFRNNKPVSDTVMVVIEKVIPLPPIQVDQVNPGLICRYYEGDWNSLPDFASLEPLKNIEEDNFDLESRMHDDYYGFEFEGLIQIPEDGVYDFYTDSDDGSRLFIDDSLVVDNDGLHGMHMEEGTIALASGMHKIRVTYFEKGGGDDLKVYYDGPDFDRMAVPASVLFKPK
ncbi:MAG: alpha-L-fucosidase [Bacteroidales bacterium]|nr:alpha-L-fucosidase [Bacteroidales bacterium]